MIARAFLVALAVAGCAGNATPSSSAPKTEAPRDIRLTIAPKPNAGGSEVRLVARKAAVHVAGGGGSPMVVGTIRSSDPTLLPHVTDNARGVAIVQDFSPRKEETPNIVWDLQLGSAPIRLDAHLLSSEDLDLDLGGCSLVWGRLYGEGGHLRLDWSAPNRSSPDLIELWSIGYLEVRHLGHSRAARVALKSLGLGTIDVGPVLRPMTLDVEASTGKLVITVPNDLPVLAKIGAQLQMSAEGWEQHDETFVRNAAEPPRLTIAMKSSLTAVELRVAP